MYWGKQWKAGKETTSTMLYLDIKPIPIGNPHHILQLVPSTTIEVKKAEIKAGLVTRTYTMQSDRAQFTRGRKDDTCLLCGTNIEDTNHFLLQCPVFSTLPFAVPRP